MSYRAARPGTPRMPDAPIAQAAPMPKRADLSYAELVEKLNRDDPDFWWKRIVCVMRRPEGNHLLVCQIEFATKAWQLAGKPIDWTPPGWQESLDGIESEAVAERRAIQGEPSLRYPSRREFGGIRFAVSPTSGAVASILPLRLCRAAPR